MNTNKIDLIKAEIERLKSQLLRGACSSQIAMETICKEEAYNEVIAILDSLQEEPVSEDLEEEIQKTIYNHFFDLEGIVIIGSSLYATVEDMVYIAKHFANWQKQHMMKEPVSEDLEEEINRYLNYRSSSPQNPIEYNRDLARHFAQWGAEHVKKQQEILHVPETCKENGDSFTHEDVSEDFEEQVKALWKEVNTGHTYSIIGSYNIFYGVCLDIANWQKEQDKETIELAEDHAMLAGMEKMKEEMMAKAIDATIGLAYENKTGRYTHIMYASRPLPVGNNKIAIIFKED